MSAEAFLPPPEPENETFVMRYEDDSEVPGILRVAGATADPVKDYLAIIGRTPLLKAEEEVELAKDIEAGLMAEHLLNIRDKGRHRVELSETERKLRDRWQGRVALKELEWLVDEGHRAKNHMLEANLRLVVSIAKRYSGRGMAFLDLVQEGNLGLVRAVEKFDYQKGYKFSTYATWWIQQAITRGMADKARTIRIPVHMVEIMNKMSRVERTMTADLGREPTLAELARELDVTEQKIAEMMRYNREPVSLETPLGDGGGRGRGQSDSYFGDLIEDTDALSAGEIAQFHDLQRALGVVLSTLTEREAGVIEMRYGLKDGQPKTLDEIGRVYGVTRERIRQIESKAMARLRHPSVSAELRDFLQ